MMVAEQDAEATRIAGECEACPNEAAAVVGVALCGSCSRRVVEQDLAERLQYLDWLTPTRRGDLLACAVRGDTHAERAAERDVRPETVGRAVQGALDRLADVVEQEGTA